MNLSTIIALLSMATALLGKSAGTAAHAQAVLTAENAIAIAQDWITEQTAATTTTAFVPPPVTQAYVPPTLPNTRPVTVTQPMATNQSVPPPAPIATPTTPATTTPSTPIIETISESCGYPCPRSYSLSSTQIQQGITTIVGNAERNAGNNSASQTNKIIAQGLQSFGLASWSVSAPDNTELTSVKIAVDPGLQGYITGLTVYVGGTPWTSADGTTWGGSGAIVGGEGNFATINVYANLEQGDTATFNGGVTLSGITGKDIATGAAINQ